MGHPLTHWPISISDGVYARCVTAGCKDGHDELQQYGSADCTLHRQQSTQQDHVLNESVLVFVKQPFRQRHSQSFFPGGGLSKWGVPRFTHTYIHTKIYNAQHSFVSVTWPRPRPFSRFMFFHFGEIVHLHPRRFRVPNFNSVALLILEICLRECQIL